MFYIHFCNTQVQSLFVKIYTKLENKYGLQLLNRPKY
jgi:hypothetical protein